MDINQRCYGYQPAQSQLDQMRAKIIRLEAALQHVIDFDALSHDMENKGMKNIARNALGLKAK